MGISDMMFVKKFFLPLLYLIAKPIKDLFGRQVLFLFFTKLTGTMKRDPFFNRMRQNCAESIEKAAGQNFLAAFEKLELGMQCGQAVLQHNAMRLKNFKRFAA